MYVLKDACVSLQVYGYNAWEEGMEISVTHVKQKDLPDYAFPDGTRPLTDLEQNPPVSQPQAAASTAPASLAGAEAAAQQANANLAEAMQEGSAQQGVAKRRRISGEGDKQVDAEERGEDEGMESAPDIASEETRQRSGEKRKRQAQAGLSWLLVWSSLASPGHTHVVCANQSMCTPCCADLITAGQG